MERIIINTGFDGFILLDSISEITGEKIVSSKNFYRNDIYSGIETLAQLGAFHLRGYINFRKHAFLLQVKRCSIKTAAKLSGTYDLSGEQLSRSRSAFLYHLKAVQEKKIMIEGEFIYALSEYDTGFRKEILENHYKNILQCLKNKSQTK